MKNAPVPALLLVGGAPYFSPAPSQHKHLARAWRDLGGRVLYLELGGDGTLFRARNPARAPAVEAEADILVTRLEVPFGLPWSFPDILRRFNLRSRLPLVRRALEQAGLRKGAFVALYYGWFWGEWMDALGARADIYDCIDEHRDAAPVAGRHALAAYVWATERRMLERTDLLLVPSPVLLEERAKIAKRSAVLAHGVDRAHFLPATSGSLPEPHALRGLPHPRLLLSGNLQPKLDFEAVGRLAEEHPGWSVALVGRCEKGARLPRNRANLRWLGPKPFAELPAVMAHTDLGLIPLRDTPYNRASAPLKLLEYLAAGLPVVASANPVTEEWRARHPKWVHLVERGAPASAWGSACATALRHRARARRTEIAVTVRELTYDTRARKLAELATALPTGGGTE